MLSLLLAARLLGTRGEEGAAKLTGGSRFCTRRTVPKKEEEDGKQDEAEGDKVVVMVEMDDDDNDDDDDDDDEEEEEEEEDDDDDEGAGEEATPTWGNETTSAVHCSLGHSIRRDVLTASSGMMRVALKG